MVGEKITNNYSPKLNNLTKLEYWIKQKDQILSMMKAAEEQTINQQLYCEENK